MLHLAGVIGLTTARCEKAKKKKNSTTDITLTDTHITCPVSRRESIIKIIIISGTVFKR